MDEQRPLGVSILRAIIIGFGLLLFNLIFILGPYVAIWGAIIAFVTSGIAFIISGVVFILTYFFTFPFNMTVPLLILEHPTLMLLSGGLLIGAGGILTTLTLWFSKYLCIATGIYAKWNFKVIRGDEHE